MIISWRAVLATIQSGLGIGQKPERNRALTATVRETLRRSGCPLCHLVTERVQRSLEAVLYEQVTDPETHRELVASRGFCFEHSWALVAASEQVYSKHGVATIHLRLIRNFLRSVERKGLQGARRWLTPDDTCPACTVQKQVLKTYAPEVARVYSANPDLVSDQPAILCRPHLVSLLERMPATTTREVQERVNARHEQILREDSPKTARPAMFGQSPILLPSTSWCPACVSAQKLAANAPADTCCAPHAWMLDRDFPPETAASSPGDSCSLCSFTSQSQPEVLATFHTSEDLCLGHLKQGLKLDERTAETILRRNVAGMERLASDLQRFCESADYRFTGTLTETERISWRAAVARFAGDTPGMDLHVFKSR